MGLRLRLGLWALACVVACSAGGSRLEKKDDGSGAGEHGPHDLTAITVQPTNLILEIDLGAATAQEYTAYGHYLDGETEDLTAQVSWSVTNPAVGSFNGGTLEIPAFNSAAVEFAHIDAAYEGFTGQAQITLVAYQKSGPNKDFFFVLPYEDPTGTNKQPLDFSTEVPKLDVFFLMDTTGSMYGSISNLQSGLTSQIVPGIQAAVADTQFGAGIFEDFPLSPFGEPSCTNGADQPFTLFQAITADIASVNAGITAMSSGGSPHGCGYDTPESVIEALYQVASGEGLTGPSPTNVAANSVGVGGVGYREDTMRVVVPIGDAVSHTVGVAALTGFGADCSPQADLEDFATSTEGRVPPEAWDVPARPPGCPVGQCCTAANGVGRAPDADGLCPLVFLTDGSGSGLGTHIVTGISLLTRYGQFDVVTEKEGVTEDTDGVDLAMGNTADFIKSIVPTGFMLPPAPPVVPSPTFDATTFFGVTPTTTVTFDVEAYNDFVPATDQPQIFQATIRVLAGGCTALDEREVLILVPATDLVVE